MSLIGLGNFATAVWVVYESWVSHWDIWHDLGPSGIKLAAIIMHKYAHHYSVVHFLHPLKLLCGVIIITIY